MPPVYIYIYRGRGVRVYVYVLRDQSCCIACSHHYLHPPPIPPQVEIFEARRFVGGKVGSWVDKDGNHIEMGLHVFFGCGLVWFCLVWFVLGVVGTDGGLVWWNGCVGSSVLDSMAGCV